MRNRARDRGSGSVLTVAIVGSVVGLTAVAIPSYMALAERQQLVGAADSAALAAADTVTGAIAGDPCSQAGVVAHANGAHLDACEVDGYVVTVAVSTTLLGIRVTARATAGPPTSAHD